ncbi:hypothetical protein IW261DRAFT_1480849 [Armillaria novae-zelandiae]|uniref:Uncharacterized protein n=1 Tax=Armillaria novae-zelandiae TaxID=153914 RepID=A0AA39P721_9AGAR|nr:hypothetical protein IW261DRAFT_1480849 [Armillaria novae-zelandiae]
MTCCLLRRPVLHSRTPTSPLFIQYRSLRLPPIQTLNPKALTESDFRDVSGKNFLCSAGHSFHYSHIKSKTRISFPDKTMGFLHYWTHSDLPATAGQVRFRLTSANDPSLFESGSDLLKPDGTPWAIPLAKLLKLRGNGSGFVQTLLNDGLVSKDLIRSKCFHLYEKLRLHDNSLLVESPADVSPVSLPRSTLKIYTVSSNEVARVRLYFDDQSWVENLKLAEPGKRVHAHARLHVSGNSLPALQVVRIFTPSGAQLDSSWPSIRSVACLGRHDKAFQSWSLQTTK